MTDLLEPQIETCLKPVDFLETLADLYRRIETCPQFEKSKVYLEQCARFRGVSIRSCSTEPSGRKTKTRLICILRYGHGLDFLPYTSRSTAYRRRRSLRTQVQQC
ncbi:hypothetical protein K1719_021729 [Acacia pycnantha]|nr:hypothetical protein K1719_021729 [Acacia pycnantha]